MNSQSVQFMSSFDPYLYQTMTNLLEEKIVVQTTKNPIQGILKSVMPDHITLEVHRTPFYIRCQEIVWVSQA